MCSLHTHQLPLTEGDLPPNWVVQGDKVPPTATAITHHPLEASESHSQAGRGSNWGGGGEPVNGYQRVEKPPGLPRPPPKCPDPQLASNSSASLQRRSRCRAGRGAGGGDVEGRGSPALTHCQVTDKSKASWEHRRGGGLCFRKGGGI